ncbi:M48 family peptidase [Rhodobacteraceae bacterium CCMM004]|nr:M48 family peptidase [Rhodobacteraceae bacterium CCMM004]
MCTSCFSRRRFLTLGAVSAATLTAGCDGPPNLVSDAEVERMGLQAWDDMQRRTPVSGNREMREVLGLVATRLLQVGGHDPGDWEVAVFASPQINAFALPGRKIGVFEGMFGVTQNADQLAAIVGHEIGHLEAEHGHKRVNAQAAKNTGIRLVAWLLNLGEVEYADEIAAALGLGVEVGLMLPYSREQELEADRLGIELMAEARFDAAQAVMLWQRMQSATGGRGPEFLGTHPTPASRIREIEEILATLPA